MKYLKKKGEYENYKFKNNKILTRSDQDSMRQQQLKNREDKGYMIWKGAEEASLHGLTSYEYWKSTDKFNIFIFDICFDGNGGTVKIIFDQFPNLFYFIKFFVDSISKFIVKKHLSSPRCVSLTLRKKFSFLNLQPFHPSFILHYY